jgi:hypothetical protein
MVGALLGGASGRAGGGLGAAGGGGDDGRWWFGCLTGCLTGMNAALKMAATESAFAGVPVHFAVWQADDYPDSEKPSS